MDRRTFMLTSGGGLGCLALSHLGGCASEQLGFLGGGGGDTIDVPHTVGDEHLIFDEDSVAYILDVDNHRVIEVDGDQRRGEFASLGDEPGELNFPVDAAVGPDRRLYVVDYGNSRVQAFDASGNAVATFGGHGDATGELSYPRDVVVHDDRILVCDTFNNRVEIFDLDGNHRGSFGSSRTLNGPQGLAVASNGEMHIVDVGDASVHVFSADGEPRRRYGGFGSRPGKMKSPRGIAVSDGLVFIADPSAGFVHAFREDGTFEGRFRPVDDRGEPAAPVRVSVMADGQLYIWTAGHAGHES